MISDKLKIFLGYLLICLLWGSTWLVIKMGLESITPFLSAGLRFCTAALFFFIIIRIKNIKVATDTFSLKLYFAMGFFSFVIPFGLVYWAEDFIPSGLASILFAAYPFFVIIFTKIFFQEEEVNKYKIFGSVLGFIGIVVIFSDGLKLDFGKELLGYIAVIISALMQGMVAVVIKKHGKKLNPVSMNLVPVFIAGIVLTILGLLVEDRSKLVFDFNAYFSIIYLALFGTIATFSTYYWLMKKISVVLLSLSAFITPIVAVLLGWLILDEILTARELFGSSLVLIGILFANLKGLISILYDKKVIKWKI
ncbi:MAG: EamA family transporter [bacterium]